MLVERAFCFARCCDRNSIRKYFIIISDDELLTFEVPKRSAESRASSIAFIGGIVKIFEQKETSKRQYKLFLDLDASYRTTDISNSDLSFQSFGEDLPLVFFASGKSLQRFSSSLLRTNGEHIRNKAYVLFSRLTP